MMESSHLVLAAVIFLLTLIVPAVVLLCLPQNYLRKGQDELSKDRNSLQKILFTILLNLLGIVVLIAGIIMLFTPGQGVLTIALGILMTSFPGKEKALRYILSDNVLKRVNTFRLRFGRAPLIR